MHDFGHELGMSPGGPTPGNQNRFCLRRRVEEVVISAQEWPSDASDADFPNTSEKPLLACFSGALFAPDVSR